MLDESATLRTVPVHRSLIRPGSDHVMGAERGPVVMLLALVFIFGWLLFSVPTLIIAAILALVGIPVLRAMAKRDPSYSRVAIRRLLQRREYDAHAYTTAKPRFVYPQQ